jgi:hypothetical protein
MNLAEKSSRRPATKSNRVVSVQTHMRRANLDNMFAPLFASGWINQPHAQTPLQQLMLKSEKYFMKLVSPTEGKNRAFSSSGVAFDVSLLGTHG